jgi:hypothetical protein
VWNIGNRYTIKSMPYLHATGKNIPRLTTSKLSQINDLCGFRQRTENPRVGGSIPPLATINQ